MGVGSLQALERFSVGGINVSVNACAHAHGCAGKHVSENRMIQQTPPAVVFLMNWLTDSDFLRHTHGPLKSLCDWPLPSHHPLQVLSRFFWAPEAVAK